MRKGPRSDAELPWSAASLQFSALDALGDCADPRARRLLTRGELHIERDMAGWEASTGRMRGHRVTLLLDPELFEEVDRAPALVDAICAAVALAASRAPGHALADFVVRGSNAEIRRGSPYRTLP
jgi:hypothetical protein